MLPIPKGLDRLKAAAVLERAAEDQRLSPESRARSARTARLLRKMEAYEQKKSRQGQQ